MPLNIFDEYVSFFLKLCVSFFRNVTFRFADYTMLAVFALLSNYLFFQGIYHIFFEERGNEGNIPAIKHIETPEVKRLYPNDSINPLKYYDYVPIQKKDSLRREYLA